MSSTTADPLHTTAYFLVRDELYKTDKPFSLRYEPEAGQPRRNTRLEQHKISIKDIRSDLKSFKWVDHGCQILHLDSGAKYDKFEDEQWVKNVYLKEIANKMRDFFNAEKVHIFEHRIRKQSAEFPIATGKTYQFDQPSLISHVDTTCRWALSVAQILNGGRADEILKHRVQCINVWKPLRGPVKEWPLALCSSKTVNPTEDLEACDLRYSDYTVENMQTYYSEAHEWFYLSDQMPTEAWMFLQSDTEPGAKPVPHTSFPVPGIKAGDYPPRESIEVRALVYYGGFDQE